MPNEYQIAVKDDGTLEFIYDDALNFLLTSGCASVARASHVEPTQQGQWTADMSPVGGPVLGPFKLRSEALAAEVEWLQSRLGTL